MKKTVVATLIALTLLTGCGPKELTPEQKQEVANLKNELSRTETEISAANETGKQFAGGLIKNLVTARLEVLETNKALLEQRINAIEAGAKIDIAVSSVKPDPELANSIKAEMDTLNSRIDEAKADANQYSGGLIQALKLSTVATQEQSMAMLQQKYLIAKYGLAEIKVDTPPMSNAKVDKEPAQQNSTPQQSPKLPPAEGPFGLEAGLSKQNIEDMTGVELKLLENSVNLYTTSKLPKQNADFEVFGLQISPKVGLCQIRAVGKSINTDSYGIALKSKFEELSNALTSIYGKADKRDYLLSGSLWKEPQDWVMGLNKKERILSAEWKGEKGSSLKNNLSMVSLDVRATGTDTGYLYLQYNFTNDSTCKEEVEGAKKSSL